MAALPAKAGHSQYTASRPCEETDMDARKISMQGLVSFIVLLVHSMEIFYQTTSSLMVFVLPCPPATGPPVSSKLSPGFSPS